MANDLSVVYRISADIAGLKDGVAKAQQSTAGLEKSATSLGTAFDSSFNKIADASKRGIGTVTAELLLAQKEVKNLQTLVLKNADKPGFVSALGYELDAAIPKVNALERELSGLQTKFVSASAPTQALGGFFGDLSKSIVSTAAGFVSAQAVLGAFSTGFHTLTGFVSDSIDAYANAETAQKKLTTALQAQGRATPGTIESFNKLATQFQKTTVYSDDLITSMQALLVQVGNVVPEQMQAALEASTNLSAGLGIDLENATMLVAKAFGTGGEELGKLKNILGDAAPKGEDMAAVLEAINSKFGGQAAAQIETYAGSIQQMANAWDSVKEAVGKSIVQDPLIQMALRRLADAANDADGKANSFTGTIVDLVDATGLLPPGLDALVTQLDEVARASRDLTKQTKDIENYYASLKRLQGGLSVFRSTIQGEGIPESERKKLDDALAQANEKARMAAERLLEQLHQLERAGYQDSVAFRIMATDLEKVGQRDDSVLELKKAFDEVTKSVQLALSKIREITSIQWPSDLQDMLKNLGTSGQGVLPLTRITVPPGGGILPKGETGIKPGIDLGMAFTTGFERGIHDLPNSIVRAIEGGGNVVSAIGSTIGESIGDSINKSLQKSITDSTKGPLAKSFLSGLSDLIPVAGALLGPLIDKLFSIGGPSKAELAGRDVVAKFEQQFSGTEDMINQIGAAYVANGKSANDAQMAIQKLWAAEKQGADATKRALQEINEELAHHKEVTDAIHAEGFQSQDEIRHAADIANQAYEEMLKSGQYTADQVDKAYRHYQELLAQLEGAAGEAARAWLKAHEAADGAVKASSDAMQSAENDLKGLLNKRDSLAASIAGEAPEAVMGVIETQQRAELKALDGEIQRKADDYAKLAKDTGQEMAQAIIDALSRIHIDPLHIGVILDPAGGGAGSIVAGGPTPGSFTPGGRTETTNPYAGLDYQTYFRDYWAPDRATVLAGIPHAATGGMVRNWGIEHFATGGIVGRDSVPTMLTPGEMVLTHDQQGWVGSMMNGASERPLQVTVQSYLDGQLVAENTVTKMAQDKRGLRTKTQRALGVG